MTPEQRAYQEHRARCPAPASPPLAPAYVLFLTCRHGHTSSTTLAFELGYRFAERHAEREAGTPLNLGVRCPRRGGQARCTTCGSAELTPTIDTRFAP